MAACYTPSDEYRKLVSHFLLSATEYSACYTIYMSKTAWIIFSALCVLLLGGLIWAAQSNKLDVSKVDSWQIQTATKDNGEIADHVFGNKDAKVRIVEYGDFQCPGCGAAYPVMKEMSQKYSEDVAFIFRNFPLSSIHPNARAAAAAAESAGLLGKYWEMHDKLYENQNNWETLSGQDRTNTFASYAVSLGMDKDKFIAGLTDERVLNKIDYDTALGTKVGVSGTPSIYVNGKIADQSVKDGKLVAGNNTDPLVWSSSDLFDKYAVDPAIKAAK